MSNLSSRAAPAITSPCIGVCTLDANGQCQGCRRTTNEIARWSQMGEPERQWLMDHELPERERRSPHLLPELPTLQSALHPLQRVPGEKGWNHDELADLLPPGPLREAAVLVGLVPRPEGTRVLLTRRNDALRNHGGQVSFPGGSIDRSDPGVVAAALRETREEIDVAPSLIQPIGFLDPFTTISAFRVTPVVAIVDPAYQARPNPGEVAEVFEVPLQFLMRPDNLRQVVMQYKQRQRTVLEYNWPGQRIWGATAAILYNLRKRLEQGQ